MPPEVWSIHLLGGFRVEAPDGAAVSISSRKGKALVALLALNDGIAISRELLGGYLWPDKPRESQQQNLRQAVKDVRRAFAPVDALQATRDVCRLALENFTCDAAECLRAGRDAGALTLLPEMPEPVFDTYRTELASFAPTGELGEAVRSASLLLEWTLAREPSRTLEMLHAFRSLMANLPLPQLEAALRTGLAQSAASDPLRGWAEAQHAVVLMWAGRFEEGVSVAKSALSASRPEIDPSSWTNAACSAAFILILRGRFEAAAKLLDGAIAIAQSLGLNREVNFLRHAHALRLLHGGDFRGALAVFASLNPAPLSEVHYAVCLALAGQVREGRAKLQSAIGLAGDSDDPRLLSQIDVTEGYILLYEGRIDEARVLFNRLAAFCEDRGFRLVRIHALEGLALLEPDPKSARALIKHAISLRERFALPLLPGDRIRLARIIEPA
ncbi:MAG TPA: hypothetical protein VHE55_11245 [Fimbriimonadaceae bacterium]|nr:hypothetical protein [Fimbriimonadaceae bacterium]